MLAQPGRRVLVEAGGLGDVLGQIFRQIADMSASLLGAAEDPPSRAPAPPKVTVCAGRVRFSGSVDSAHVGNGGAGIRVHEALGAVVPARHVITAVALDVVRRPPHLVIRGGRDRAQLGARDATPDRGVEVRCPATLWFDGSEVLHVPPNTAASVLPEPVDDLREVDRVPSRPPVVVAVRVPCGPVLVYRPYESRVRVRNVDGR